MDGWERSAGNLAKHLGSERAEVRTGTGQHNRSDYCRYWNPSTIILRSIECSWLFKAIKKNKTEKGNRKSVVVQGGIWL